MIKICSKWNKVKWLESDFRIRKHREKFSYITIYRECEHEERNKYRKTAKYQESVRLWKKNDYVKEAMKLASKKCMRKRYADPEKRQQILNINKKCREKRLCDLREREKDNKKSRERYQNQTEEAKIKHSERGKKNRQQIKLNPILHEAEKRKKRIKLQENPKLKLSNWIALGMRNSLKGNKRNRSWRNYVNYTVEELKKHLEKQFKEGMTWDNHGQWHIDHKIPISAFNFTKPEHLDFKKCWALKNLQPMWAFKNISKSNKLNKSFQPSLLLAINE